MSRLMECKVITLRNKITMYQISKILLYLSRMAKY